MLREFYYQLLSSLPLHKELAILNPHNANSKTMTVEQILQKEIEESTTWLDRQNEETAYKRDL